MKEKQDPETSGRKLKGSAPSISMLDKINRELHCARKDLEEKYENLNVKLEETNLELKRSLAEKERIRNYLDNILESLTSGVLAIDLSGNITLFNRTAENLLGYPAEEAIGKRYLDVMGSELEEELTLPFVLKSKQSHLNTEKEVWTKDGRKVPVGFSTSLLRDREGVLLGAVEVLYDLRQVKRMEEEIMRVKTLAAIGEMAAVVVHEVKNPLGGIRGFAELLERDLGEGDPRRRSVKKILEGVETLDRIVKSLLDYTKPVRLNPRRVEMSKFIDEVIGFFEMDGSQKEANVHIEKKYPEGELFCHLDNQQFRQTLLNLLHNAVQAMPRGGKLIIELDEETEGSDLLQEARDRVVVLRISDTGVGMCQETLQKLFTPFFTTKEAGTGLGLSTVKKIVEAHRGRIKVDSAPGEGTTVWLRLPMA
ncbi:MAG: PAS domain S-box protein [candidate division Zixibacteria bacterium]|nr:PAS domain S-box protein [candidate division Zixibacteria bacterium]